MQRAVFPTWPVQKHLPAPLCSSPCSRVAPLLTTITVTVTTQVVDLHGTMNIVVNIVVTCFIIRTITSVVMRPGVPAAWQRHLQALRVAPR